MWHCWGEEAIEPPPGCQNKRPHQTSGPKSWFRVALAMFPASSLSSSPIGPEREPGRANQKKGGFIFGWPSPGSLSHPVRELERDGACQLLLARVSGPQLD